MRRNVTRFFRTLLFLLVVSALSAACAGGGGGTDEAGVSIRIMRPGDEPRQVLRYTFEAGRTETVVFEMGMTVREFNFGQKVSDQTIPPMRMTMDVESRTITPEGNLEYGVELTAMDMVDDGTLNAAQLAAVREALQPLVGLTAWGTVTPAGEALETHYSNPPGLPPELEATMDGVQEQMGQMFSPLPDEPVGQDAMWTVRMPMSSAQFDFTQEMTFWLVKLEGDYCEVSVTVRQQAEAQDAKELPAGVPAGYTIHLENLESSGYGSQTFRLSDIAGTADLTLEMGMDFTVDTGSGTQNRRSEMDMQLKVLPGGTP